MVRTGLFFGAVLAVALGPVAVQAGQPLGGVISEVKGGVYAHDVARDNSGKAKESNTVDLNGEVLFVPLPLTDSENSWVRTALNPRVHLGFAANTEGYTNHVYAGLTWDHRFTSGIFVEGEFGIAGNDGELKNKRGANGAIVVTGRPKLGSAVTFREGVDLGYRFSGGHSLAGHISHISHAGWFASANDGMTFAGVRYGYRFD
ncbi:Acyloxyacyl hydrolase [uncultured Gammaproteobacteria bacterium]